MSPFLPSAHPHYALLSNSTHSAIKKSASKAFNIEFIEYEEGNYKQIDDMLNELTELVLACRAQESCINQQFREKHITQHFS